MSSKTESTKLPEEMSLVELSTDILCMADEINQMCELLIGRIPDVSKPARTQGQHPAIVLDEIGQRLVVSALHSLHEKADQLLATGLSDEQRLIVRQMRKARFDIWAVLEDVSEEIATGGE